MEPIFSGQGRTCRLTPGHLKNTRCSACSLVQFLQIHNLSYEVVNIIITLILTFYNILKKAIEPKDESSLKFYSITA